MAVTRRRDGSGARLSIGSEMTHPGLTWLEESAEGRAWLEQVPARVAECAERWSLRVGEPFAYASASLAIPATGSDGTRVVLKIQFPHREGEHEAAALALHDGDGAARLLAYDEERRALLLERCEPGTPLHELELDDALDVITGL